MILVFPLGSYEKRTRLVKVVKLLQRESFELNAWVWQRDKSDANSTGVHRSVLLSGGGYMPRRSSLWYALWIVVVFWKALWKKKASGPLYCLGFESAFPIWLASSINRSLVYAFDDADRFSMLNNFPWPVQRALCFLERKVSEGSLVHIVPTLERYEFRNCRQLVVFNMPTRSSVEDSLAIQLDSEVLEKLQGVRLIYVSGRLVEHRGLGVALALSKMLEDRSDVAFICCGYTHGSVAEEFVQRPNVYYFGEVKQDVSLAWASRCQWTLTLYDPKIEINRFALANKWGDCLTTGSVPIVNSEVITAGFLRDADACISVDYCSVNELFEVIEDQLDNPHLYNITRLNLTRLGKVYGDFEQEFSTVVQRLGAVQR